MTAEKMVRELLEKAVGKDAVTNSPVILEMIKFGERCYLAGQQSLETKARHWCIADPESSLVPNLSSWRLFDHLFVTKEQE